MQIKISMILCIKLWGYKMKTCFVIQGLKKGGAERVLSLIANKFYENGDDVIIALSETPDDIMYPVNSGINIVDVSNHDPHSSLILKRCNMIRNLRELLKKEKPDVCISFITRTNICTIIASKGLKIPVIISERNNPLVDPKRKLTRLLRDIIYPFAKGFVFQTEFAASCFPERIVKRSVVIPNPVTDEVYNEPEKVQKRKEIITACRLENQKNIPMLIKAFSNIVQTYQEYKLLIYGEGSLRDSLEQMILEFQISDKVKLMGQRDDLIQLMFNSEIFVLSSDYEGMPNALAEAMSVGLACISTDCPAYGSRFLIQDQENGILIPVGNQQALEDALNKLINDRKLYLKVSQNARLVKDRLSEKKIVNMWREYIEKVLNS
jgi:glycosyltransferase involved in cell wall biosynthesis